ncbi:ttv [Symbiodinium microadriaticum]|nr:ttv [Symbiodinium microadriaticum]
MAMEDFLPVPFEEWVQEPEVIIGLVMAGVAPVAVPALICSEFWFNGGSSDGVHKDTAYYQEVVRTTALLWEGSCVFLLVYGCVQYTTTGAMIGVFFYSVVRSIAMTIVTYARVKKENNGHGVTDEPLEPVSVYTDIEAGTFLKCASVFVLQMLLYVLLLRWIASKSFSEEETTEQELVRYAAGSVVATVQRVMSQGFHSGELKPFWMTYFFSGHGQYRRHYHYPKMRLLMSWIVNDILFTTVFLLLPLVTMGSDNDMEFVKDCTAVLFISQFDSFEADIGEGHYLRAGREDKDEKRGKETVPAELATHTAEAVSDKGTEMEEQTGVNHAKDLSTRVSDSFSVCFALAQTWKLSHPDNCGRGPRSVIGHGLTLVAKRRSSAPLTAWSGKDEMWNRVQAFFPLICITTAIAASPVRFFLYPPHFERDGFLSIWYSQLYEELQLHPWRTTSPEEASIFFLGIDVSCAYLWPVYSAPVPGAANYVTQARWGTLGDARACRESRQARLEAYVRNGWATYWGTAGKQHIVFDQLCYHPLSELVHAHHSVTLAGVGQLKGRPYGYRSGIDISWPEMPVTVEQPPLRGCSCSPRKRLVSFQGAQTRPVRQKLRALHDGDEIVVNVVDVSKSALNTTDARWDISHPIKSEYAALMRESEFALAPAGHSPCSLRLYEIMSFCAIPVILADDKLLPFSEILNWSEMAVILPESAAATVPDVLRALGPEQRCRMRRQAAQAFHSYFANVSANVRGLLEVASLNSKEGWKATSDSQKLASDFREQSSALAWSPFAVEDLRRQRLALQWLPAVSPSMASAADCRISWDDLQAHSASAHSESLTALVTWALASLGVLDMGATGSFRQLRNFGLQDHFLEHMDASGDPVDVFRSSSAALEALVRAAVAARDGDKDGKLNLQEFEVEASKQTDAAPLQFSKLDADNDSALAIRELLVEQLSLDGWVDSLRRGFELADADKDGRLSGLELEREQALPLLHMMEEYPTSTRARVSDVREARRNCAGVRSAQSSTAQLVSELRSCGYIHVQPDWFDQGYAAGPVTTRSAGGFASSESEMHLVLEQTSPVIGFIPEVKNDRFVADERNSFCGGSRNSDAHPSLRTRDGYAARFLAAGTVIVYDWNLVQRPFCIKNTARFLRYDLVAAVPSDRLSGLRVLAGVDPTAISEHQRQTALQQVMLAESVKSDEL